MAGKYSWKRRASRVAVCLSDRGVWVFHPTIYRRVAEWDRDPVPPIRARCAGFLSLFFWTSVVVCGRVGLFPCEPGWPKGPDVCRGNREPNEPHQVKRRQFPSYARHAITGFSDPAGSQRPNTAGGLSHRAIRCISEATMLKAAWRSALVAAWIYRPGFVRSYIGLRGSLLTLSRKVETPGIASVPRPTL